jgi:hypothetical protein
MLEACPGAFINIGSASTVGSVQSFCTTGREKVATSFDCLTLQVVPVHLRISHAFALHLARCSRLCAPLHRGAKSGCMTDRLRPSYQH